MRNYEAFEFKAFSHLCQSNEKKPIEIYLFIDPLCPECWSLEPTLKKLSIEYGQYFTVKHVISGKLTSLNRCKKQNNFNLNDQREKTSSRYGMSCDGNLWIENPFTSPYLASIAIKAAELQGRKAGIRFFRKLQEVLFLEKQNIFTFEVLKICAFEAGIDVEEFINDIHSESAAKALQCDLKITSEMEVTEIPTLVFFNQNIEEEGIKITGHYPYNVYVQIIEEMLQEEPVRTAPPPLELFLKHFKLVASKEIAVVYNKTIQEVERELKKLQLKQQVEKVPAKNGTFWKYILEE